MCVFVEDTAFIEDVSVVFICPRLLILVLCSSTDLRLF